MLRPVAEGDLPMLERFSIDPAAAGPFEWHGWSNPAQWRRRWAENGMLGDEGGLLLVLRGGVPAGFVAWHKVVTARGSFCWNMGVNLLPEARGFGVGTAAQRLLVEHLFAHTQVARIQAGTELDNLAEQRVLEKIGFSREGVMRSYAFRGGEWRDVVLYSILRG